MQASGLTNSYAYSLKKLLLYTSGGDILDISKMFLEMDIFEDLFSPTMTAKIRIGDAMDLLSKFKFHGNEFIELEIDKPEFENPLKKVFRVYKIADRDMSTTLQNYTLYLCSEEMILSPQIQISKSFKGLSITQIIKNILSNYLKVNPKKINQIAQTDGVYDIIVPRMNPFEAIQWLGTRAYTSKGSLYFFYENRDGFNFLSYEDMIKAAPYNKYTRSVKTNTDPLTNMHTFTFLKVMEDFDLMKASRYGSFSSSLNTFDILRKSYETHYFNSVQFKNKGILNKEVTLNGFKNRLGNTFYDSYGNMQKFVITTDSDPTNNPMSPESWLSQTASKMGQLHLFKMIGTVPGDVGLKVGATIDLDMQNFTPQEKEADLNPVRSGKYLVSAVHHKFTGDIYTTVVELLSDSINAYMPVAVNNSSKLSELIKT